MRKIKEGFYRNIIIIYVILTTFIIYVAQGHVSFLFIKSKQYLMTYHDETNKYENSDTVPASASPIIEDLSDSSTYRIMLFKEKSFIKLNTKEVFLTFDDGPSKNTLKILDILNKNDVKATFFVIGKKVEENPNILKRLKDNNMCIAAHTYSHNYKIYSSSAAYFKDLNACNAAIDKVIGYHDKGLIRLPGGSDTQIYGQRKMSEIRELLKENGIKYIDWNVSSADAAAKTVPASKIKENISRQCKYNKFAVILMHDANSKTTTVDALPDVIKLLKENKFIFRTFNDLTKTEETELLKRGVMNR